MKTTSRSHSTSLFFLLLPTLFSLPFSQTAFADEFSASVGLFGNISPEYEGSDEYEVGGLPVVTLGWAEDYITPKSDMAIQAGILSAELSFPEGLDIGLVRFYRPEGLYEINAAVAYNGGRDAGDSEVLKGMGDIDGHAVGGLNLAYSSETHGWFGGAGFTHDLSNETEGATFTLAGGHNFQLSETVTLSAQLAGQFANEKYMQSYFGVSATQAANSVHSLYDADSGFKSVDTEVTLNWMITENVSFTAIAGYSRLTGDAADSPLVKTKGSANQFQTTLGLAYHF